MQPRSLRPERARELRANLTDAERKLWYWIRKKRLHGLRFRRQVPIGPYIVDFACIERRLVIEVDGGQHGWQQVQDDKRTAWLEAHGWRVIRFWNNEVLGNIEGVFEKLSLEVSGSPEFPHPYPPPQAGEGEDSVTLS
jgi:very-short-patch-repair endonuclease